MGPVAGKGEGVGNVWSSRLKVVDVEGCWQIALWMVVRLSERPYPWMRNRSMMRIKSERVIVSGVKIKSSIRCVLCSITYSAETSLLVCLSYVCYASGNVYVCVSRMSAYVCYSCVCQV
jgi:hypothetical protein